MLLLRKLKWSKLTLLLICICCDLPAATQAQYLENGDSRSQKLQSNKEALIGPHRSMFATTNLSLVKEGGARALLACFEKARPIARLLWQGLGRSYCNGRLDVSLLQVINHSEFVG